MKAIVFSQYGPPDGLELKEVPRPTPKDDELLIRVHASSINSWAWEFLNGTPFIDRLMYGLLKPKSGKQILGADIAGTVEAIGRRVTRFQPGDEVFGISGTTGVVLPNMPVRKKRHWNRSPPIRLS